EFKEYKGSFATCQDEFSLACRKNEQDLRNAKEQLDVVPMTWGSLGQGILTGKYGADVKFGENDRRRRDVYVNFHGEKLKKNLEIVDAMRPIAEAHGKSLAATAIRFILDHLDDSIVIAGVKSVAQMKSNLEGLDWRLDEDELKILNEVSWE
ncbi:MAG: aldo/keto reductase, partial [Clostridia bacterium]|nr:aldo/keto reductase [Clostridia bacterium]